MKHENNNQIKAESIFNNKLYLSSMHQPKNNFDHQSNHDQIKQETNVTLQAENMPYKNSQSKTSNVEKQFKSSNLYTDNITLDIPVRNLNESHLEDEKQGEQELKEDGLNQKSSVANDLPPLMADPLTQTRSIYNDGSRLVQQMNLSLAEKSHKGAENYPLLITKEVFRVEKVMLEDRTTKPINPFDWPTGNIPNAKSNVTSYDYNTIVDNQMINEYDHILKTSQTLHRTPKTIQINQKTHNTPTQSINSGVMIFKSSKMEPRINYSGKSNLGFIEPEENEKVNSKPSQKPCLSNQTNSQTQVMMPPFEVQKVSAKGQVQTRINENIKFVASQSIRYDEDGRLIESCEKINAQDEQIINLNKQLQEIRQGQINDLEDKQSDSYLNVNQNKASNSDLLTQQRIASEQDIIYPKNCQNYDLNYKQNVQYDKKDSKKNVYNKDVNQLDKKFKENESVQSHRSKIGNNSNRQKKHEITEEQKMLIQSLIKAQQKYKNDKDFDLREFLQNEDRNYNLRKKNSDFSFNERVLMKKQTQNPQSSQQLQKLMLDHNIQDGFFDDWPEDLCQQYGLKKSDKYVNKNQLIICSPLEKVTQPKQTTKSKEVDMALTKIEESKVSITENNGDNSEQIGFINQKQITMNDHIEDKSMLEALSDDDIMQQSIENNCSDNSDKKIAKQFDMSPKTIKIGQEETSFLESWSHIKTKNKNADYISQIYRQRYKLTNELADNVAKLRLLAQKHPSKLINVFVYIFRPQFNLWRRALIKDFIADSADRHNELLIENLRMKPECKEFVDKIPRFEQQRYYQILLIRSQSKNDSVRFVNLNETCFFIDHNYRDDTFSNSSMQLENINKAAFKAQSLSPETKEIKNQQAHEIEQILKQPRFNTNRTKKLLSKLIKEIELEQPKNIINHELECNQVSQSNLPIETKKVTDIEKAIMNQEIPAPVRQKRKYTKHADKIKAINEKNQEIAKKRGQNTNIINVATTTIKEESISAQLKNQMENEKKEKVDDQNSKNKQATEQSNLIGNKRKAMHLNQKFTINKNKKFQSLKKSKKVEKNEFEDNDTSNIDANQVNNQQLNQLCVESSFGMDINKEEYSTTVLKEEWIEGMNQRIIRQRANHRERFQIVKRGGASNFENERSNDLNVFYRVIPQSGHYPTIKYNDADGSHEIEPTQSDDLYLQSHIPNLQYPNVQQQALIKQQILQYDPLAQILQSNIDSQTQIQQIKDKKGHLIFQNFEPNQQQQQINDYYQYDYQNALQQASNQGSNEHKDMNCLQAAKLNSKNCINNEIEQQQASMIEQAIISKQNKGNDIQTIVQNQEHANQFGGKQAMGLNIYQQNGSGNQSQPINDQQHLKIKSMMQKIQMYENNSFEQLEPEATALQKQEQIQEIITTQINPNNQKMHNNISQLHLQADSKNENEQNQQQHIQDYKLDNQAQTNLHLYQPSHNSQPTATFILEQGPQNYNNLDNQNFTFKKQSNMQIINDQIYKQDGTEQDLQQKQEVDQQLLALDENGLKIEDKQQQALNKLQNVVQMSQQPLRDHLLLHRQLFQQKIQDLVNSNKLLITMPQTLLMPVEEVDDQEENNKISQINMQQLLGHIGQLNNGQAVYQLFEKLKQEGHLNTMESVRDFISTQYKNQIIQYISVLQQIEKMIEQMDEQGNINNQNISNNTAFINNQYHCDQQPVFHLVNHVNDLDESIIEHDHEYEPQIHHHITECLKLIENELTMMQQEFVHDQTNQAYAIDNLRINQKKQLFSTLQSIQMALKNQQLTVQSQSVAFGAYINKNNNFQSANIHKNSQEFKEEEGMKQTIKQIAHIQQMDENNQKEKDIVLDNQDNKIQKIYQGRRSQETKNTLKKQQLSIYQLIQNVLKFMTQKANILSNDEEVNISDQLEVLNAFCNQENIDKNEMAQQDQFQQLLVKHLINQMNREFGIKSYLNNNNPLTNQTIQDQLKQIRNTEDQLKYLKKLKSMVNQLDSVGRFLSHDIKQRMPQIQNHDKQEILQEHDDKVYDFFQAQNNEGSQPKINCAFDTLEQGIEVLELGYKERKEMENHIWKMMDIQKGEDAADIDKREQNNENVSVSDQDKMNEDLEDEADFDKWQQLHEQSIFMDAIEQQSIRGFQHSNQNHFANLIHKQSNQSSQMNYPQQNLYLPPTINPYQEISSIKKQLKQQQQMHPYRAVNHNQKPNNDQAKSIYPSIQYIYTIKNPSVKKKRLKQYLENFYVNKIIKCQYKKCTCVTCSSMAYPMLIPFDVDGSLFNQNHAQLYMKIMREREKKSGQHIYNQLFCQSKSRRQFEKEQRNKFYFSILNSFQRAMVGPLQHSSLQEIKDIQQCWCLDADRVNDSMSYLVNAGYKNQLFEAVIEKSVQDFQNDKNQIKLKEDLNLKQLKKEDQLDKQIITNSQRLDDCDTKLPSISQICLVNEYSNQFNIEPLLANPESNILNQINFMQQVIDPQQKLYQNKRIKKQQSKSLSQINRLQVDEVDSISSQQSYNTSELANDHEAISKEIKILSNMQSQIMDMKTRRVVKWAKRQRHFELSKINKRLAASIDQSSIYRPIKEVNETHADFTNLVQANQNNASSLISGICIPAIDRDRHAQIRRNEAIIRKQQQEKMQLVTEQATDSQQFINEEDNLQIGYNKENWLVESNNQVQLQPFIIDIDEKQANYEQDFENQNESMNQQLQNEQQIWKQVQQDASNHEYWSQLNNQSKIANINGQAYLVANLTKEHFNNQNTLNHILQQQEINQGTIDQSMYQQYNINGNQNSIFEEQYYQQYQQPQIIDHKLNNQNEIVDPKFANDKLNQIDYAEVINDKDLINQYYDQMIKDQSTHQYLIYQHQNGAEIMQNKINNQTAILVDHTDFNQHKTVIDNSYNQNLIKTKEKQKNDSNSKLNNTKNNRQRQHKKKDKNIEKDKQNLSPINQLVQNSNANVILNDQIKNSNQNSQIIDQNVNLQSSFETKQLNVLNEEENSQQDGELLYQQRLELLEEIRQQNKDSIQKRDGPKDEFNMFANQVKIQQINSSLPQKTLQNNAVISVQHNSDELKTKIEIDQSISVDQNSPNKADQTNESKQSVEIEKNQIKQNVNISIVSQQYEAQVQEQDKDEMKLGFQFLNQSFSRNSPSKNVISEDNDQHIFIQEQLQQSQQQMDEQLSQEEQQIALGSQQNDDLQSQENKLEQSNQFIQANNSGEKVEKIDFGFSHERNDYAIVCSDASQKEEVIEDLQMQNLTQQQMDEMVQETEQDFAQVMNQFRQMNRQQTARVNVTSRQASRQTARNNTDKEHGNQNKKVLDRRDKKSKEKKQDANKDKK